MPAFAHRTPGYRVRFPDFVEQKDVPVARNTISRSLHDVGLAAWFGGTLANAVALNPAAA